MKLRKSRIAALAGVAVLLAGFAGRAALANPGIDDMRDRARSGLKPPGTGHYGHDWNQDLRRENDERERRRRQEEEEQDRRRRQEDEERQRRRREEEERRRREERRREEDMLSAARAGDAGRVREFLRDGVDPDAETDGGETALIVAAKKNDLELARVMAEAKADLDKPDSKGLTAFEYVVRGRSAPFVVFLLKAGAGRNKDAALSSTIENNDTEMRELLLSNTAWNPAECRLPLKTASGKNDSGSLDQVFNRCGSRQNAGMALRPALAQGLDAMIKKLLGYKADLDVSDGEWTPLIGAIEAGRRDLVELFLTLGADVNLVDASGRTPLEAARARRLNDIAEVLENAGGIYGCARYEEIAPGILPETIAQRPAIVRRCPELIAEWPLGLLRDLRQRLGPGGELR